ITMDRYSSSWRFMDLHGGEYHRQEAMRLESSNRLTLRCPSRSMARMVPWPGSMASFRHHRMPRALTARSRISLVEAYRYTPMSGHHQMVRGLSPRTKYIV